MSDENVTTPDDSASTGSSTEGTNVPAVPANDGGLSVPEMRAWLRNWVANATGQQADAISESTPMVELGLSSRDAVAMASDIEDLTGHVEVQALDLVRAHIRFEPAIAEVGPAHGTTDACGRYIANAGLVVSRWLGIMA